MQCKPRSVSHVGGKKIKMGRRLVDKTFRKNVFCKPGSTWGLFFFFAKIRKTAQTPDGLDRFIPFGSGAVRDILSSFQVLRKWPRANRV